MNLVMSDRNTAGFFNVGRGTEQDRPRSLRASAFRRIGALPVSDVTTPMCW